MFLATTALSAFWSSEEPITFLGPWCLRYDQQAKWSARQYTVLSSPWDDRERFYTATHYLGACYERMLSQLAEYFNEVQGITQPPRYWRILIGPWLLHFIHAVYDRYVCLTEAIHRLPNLQTIVLDSRSFQTPSHLVAFTEASASDAYNLQIFSELLEGMGYRFPAKMLDELMAQRASIEQRKWRQLTQRTLAWGTNQMAAMLARRKTGIWPIGLCNFSCPRPLIWQLAWRMKGHAMPLEVPYSWSQPIPEARHDKRRQGLAHLQPKDAFERLLIRLLPQHVPPVYFEAYPMAVAEIHRRYPVIPRVLVSANAWYFNDPLKYLAAEASLWGSRLVAVQHGSGYGILRAMPLETHEARMADAFMVWGWAPETPPYRNLARPNFAKLLRKRRRSLKRHRQQALFVATGYPQYLVRFQSAPVGGQWQEYLDWQGRFLEALSAPLRSSLRIRLYPNDYGHAVQQRLTTRCGPLQWDTGRSFYRRLDKARLVIVDHPGTTMLEALVANVPILLFWDTRRWDMRPEAVSFLETLRRVGIFCGSPEAAAKRLTMLLEDSLESWWQSEPLQRARKFLVGRYALSNIRWTEQWARALIEEAERAQELPSLSISSRPSEPMESISPVSA